VYVEVQYGNWTYGGDAGGDIMSAWLIAIVGVVYAVVAVDLIVKGNTGLGIAFVGYALGNVGLYMEAAK
jgi:hypothetical protein